MLLDTGPLGMVTHPRKHRDAKEWLQRLLRTGVRVIVPEIADYELRRSLLRLGKPKSVTRLDQLEAVLEYLPITTAAMSTRASSSRAARGRLAA